MNHFYEIALTLIKGIGKIRIRNLISIYGSAEQVFSRKSINTRISGLGDIIISENDRDEALRRAEAEVKFIEKNNITTYFVLGEEYPYRLRECEDAPTILYRRGEANLDAERLVAVVGTRNMTAYGRELTDNFICQIPKTIGNIAIVSGLAYGIDINAHRQALDNGFETVAVLAHGLDMLYPHAHRDTAKQMLNQGGLLTEYATHTNADKQNFVRRNRIVAGLCDACILVESAEHGGGRITTRLANDYFRDVFAFPGAVNMPYSMGCNTLIRDNKAALITSAFDFVQAMNWETEQRIQDARQRGIERQLFPDLTAEEQQLVTLLAKDNDQQINVLTVRSGQPVAHLISLLFQLELKGVVKALPGGCYHLLY